MKNILVIGGTRNMGYYFSKRMLDAGAKVTILNRGMTPDELPDTVHRLRADRTDPMQVKRALLAKSFDVVVDFVMHKETEAHQIIDLIKDSVGQYIFISSGQVYLVREGNIARPYREEEYEGRTQPPPKANTFAYEEWRYGIDKRSVENVFIEAHEQKGFPFTTLRLPMVNSERDTFRRLYNYILRIEDGKPLLIPETPTYPLRHVYSHDVVEALVKIVETGVGKGRAYNISQDETVTIDEFIELLGNIMGKSPQIIRVKRSLLEANGFLPDASPFTERWMSELDNTRSKEELGMEYTPLAEYLENLVNYYTSKKMPKPVGYKRRNAEVQMANQILEEQS